MNRGAANKKPTYVLICVGTFAAYSICTQMLSGPAYKPPLNGQNNSNLKPGVVGNVPVPEASGSTEKVPGRNTGHVEFHPKLHPKKMEHRADAPTVPRPLRLELLARVMKIPKAGERRDLFQFLKTPLIREPGTAEIKKELEIVRRSEQTDPSTATTSLPPSIPLHYYGYSRPHPDGRVTAYFWDGEKTWDAIEGTVIGGRYRVLFIGLDRALVEDTEQQRKLSIHIEPDLAG